MNSLEDEYKDIKEGIFHNNERKFKKWLEQGEPYYDGKPTLKERYFSLNSYGDIEYIGEFHNFDDADNSVKDSFFIAHEETIKKWKEQIDKLLMI